MPAIDELCNLTFSWRHQKMLAQLGSAVTRIIVLGVDETGVFSTGAGSGPDYCALPLN
jgi:hypothetical protein